jgi:hypothetical protein
MQWALHAQSTPGNFPHSVEELLHAGTIRLSYSHRHTSMQLRQNSQHPAGAVEGKGPWGCPPLTRVRTAVCFEMHGARFEHLLQAWRPQCLKDKVNKVSYLNVHVVLRFIAFTGSNPLLSCSIQHWHLDLSWKIKFTRCLPFNICCFFFLHNRCFGPIHLLMQN